MLEGRAMGWDLLVVVGCVALIGVAIVIEARRRSNAGSSGGSDSGGGSDWDSSDGDGGGGDGGGGD
jgi:hypothetical protein